MTSLIIDKILWISKDGKNFHTFPYYEQRKVLYYLVETLYEDNKEEFQSQDEVLNLFFKSYFDGKLIKLARLIKKSFGEEALRIISMMGEDENSSRQVLDYLKKHTKKV